MYSAFVWLGIALAFVQFITLGDGAAGAVALLLLLIQIGRALRHQRLMAF